MPEINISNSAGRDAVVNLETVAQPLQVRWLDEEGRQAQNVRFLKSDLEHDIDALTELAKSEQRELADLLLDADPDVDLESVGSFLGNTSRVYINEQNQMIRKALQYELILNPDGSVREQRPADRTQPNVSGEVPLGWSGVYMKKADIVRRYVFANKLQLSHINGLTYDFLFAIAKDLEQRDSMLLLGGGPKNNQPLILRRGSVPYRGFLEGRTRSEKYLLLLHLSNLELKAIQPTDGGDDDV